MSEEKPIHSVRVHSPKILKIVISFLIIISVTILFIVYQETKDWPLKDLLYVIFIETLLLWGALSIFIVIKIDPKVEFFESYMIYYRPMRMKFQIVKYSEVKDIDFDRAGLSINFNKRFLKFIHISPLFVQKEMIESISEFLGGKLGEGERSE